MAVGDTAADAEGFGEGESGQGMDAGANVPDSDVDGGGAWASNTAAVIGATMQHAKDVEQSRENFDPMGSAHKGTHSYYGGVNTVGDKTGSRFSAWEQENPEAKDYSPPVT